METLDASLFTQYHTIFHSGRMLVYSVLVLGNAAGSSLMYRVRMSQRGSLISTHVLGGSYHRVKYFGTVRGSALKVLDVKPCA